MKKVFFILCSSIFTFICSAQTASDSTSVLKDSVIQPKTLEERIDSMIQVNNAWLENIEIDISLKNRYKLYPTENIYTFLQLDTKTGRIEQVQWSLDEDNEGSVIINNEDLTYGYGYGSGSFELYPTQNLYQFILLDKTTGRKWHVQWGMDYKKRWIRRIY